MRCPQCQSENTTEITDAHLGTLIRNECRDCQHKWKYPDKGMQDAMERAAASTPEQVRGVMDDETYKQNMALLERMRSEAMMPVERERDPDVDGGDVECTYKYRCPYCDSTELWNVTGAPSTYVCKACHREFVALPGGTTGEEVKFPILIHGAMPKNEIRFVQPIVTMPLPGGEYNVTIRDIGASDTLDAPSLTEAGRDEQVSRAGIAFEHAAAIRERIAAALEAEIGDRATAERLAGVVARALEGE
jgi:transposase-like protein